MIGWRDLRSESGMGLGRFLQSRKWYSNSANEAVVFRPVSLTGTKVLFV